MRALNLIIMTWHFYCTNILTPTDGNSSWCPTGLPIANALKLAQARRLPQKPLDQWPAHIFVSDDDNIDDHDDDDTMTMPMTMMLGMRNVIMQMPSNSPEVPTDGSDQLGDQVHPTKEGAS